MKFSKIILVLLAVIGFAVSSPAQYGFNTFSATRTIVAATPQNIGADSGLVTNGPIDLLKLQGVGILNLVTVTNTGTTGGTLAALLYTSADQTNLVAVTNFALITVPTTDTITNVSYGGTNLTAANSVLLPGTITTPTASSSGFATPYLAPAPFTNSGAITLNGNKAVQVGLPVSSLRRYLYIVYQPGGTVTNFTAGALLTAPVKISN